MFNFFAATSPSHLDDVLGIIAGPAPQGAFQCRKPQITASATQCRVKFCTSTRVPANVYPKTGHHKRSFLK